jgi:hypothetical protein
MPIEQLRRCLESGEWDRLSDVYEPDALLDANVPQWRFQRRGIEAIEAQYRDWYPEPVRLVEWTPTSTAFGAVVEQAEWTLVAGEDTYTRSVHLLHIDSRIVRHVLYCTGRWNRSTVERHRLEAPLYEA